MNARSYKTVFSKRLGALVAVGEHASSQGKANGAGSGGGAGASGTLGYIAALTASFALVSLAWAAPATNALPTAGQVVQGTASMSQAANQLTINQSTQRAAINWQSFDIGAQAKVQVVQPNAQAVLLNRVVGQSPSQIFGQLNANGHVILVNPNGVLFGKDGSVNAASFTASTLGISDANFMAGNMVYERNGSTAGIVNEGNITTAPGGYVALLGASVSNEGKIDTKGGNAFLAAADTIKVPVSSTGRIKLELTAADMNANVSNSGSIITQGGQVYMQALALNQAAAQIIQSGSIDTTGEQGGAVHLLADGGIIKVDGRITANSNGAGNKGGDIVIGRDEVTGVLAKSTDVSGSTIESKGGFVETSAHFLAVDGIKINAGTWLLDPDNIEITNNLTPIIAGYSIINANTIATALNTTNVVINTTGPEIGVGSNSASSGDGNILVSSAIKKTGTTGLTKLTLNADNGITVNQKIYSTGSALDVEMTASGNTSFTNNATKSQGIVLNNVIDANGGVVTLTGTSKSAAQSGVQFNNGSGINAASYIVKGYMTSTAAVNSYPTQVGGVLFKGASTFNSTADSTITGSTASAGVFGVQFHNNNGTNVTFNSGAGKVTVASDAANVGGGVRIGYGAGLPVVNTSGDVTIGSSKTTAQTFVQATINATAGKLTLLGKSSGDGVVFTDGGGVGAQILGTNGANVIITGESLGGGIGVTTNLNSAGKTVISTSGISSANTAGDISITGISASGTGIYNSGAGGSNISNTSTGGSTKGNITLLGTSNAGNKNGINSTGLITAAGLVQMTGNAKGTYSGVSLGAKVEGGSVDIYGFSTGGVGVDVAAIVKSTDTPATSPGVTLTGFGGNTYGNYNQGVWVRTSGSVDSASKVSIVGTNNVATNMPTLMGTQIQGTVIAVGDINLEGYSTSGGSPNSGLVIQNTVTSTRGNITAKASNNNASKVALEISGAGALIAKDDMNQKINMVANTMNFSNATAINAGATGTVNITTKDANKAIKIGMEDSLVGAPPMFDWLSLNQAELGKITAAKTVIGDSVNTGGITVSGVTTTATKAGHITLQTGGNIDVNAALTIALGKTLTLDGAGANSKINQTAAGTIKADGLELLGTNAKHTLTNTSNQVGTIAANTKQVTYTNNGDLVVGAVNSTTGVTTKRGANITTQSGNLSINEAINNQTSGDVVVGAGISKLAGDTSGGDIKTTNGKDVTHTGGKLVVYSGSSSGAGLLSHLDSALGNLQVTGTATQNVDTNVAYNAGAGITDSTENAQVMFREKVTITNGLVGTTVENTYGDANTKNTATAALLADAKTKLKAEVGNTGTASVYDTATSGNIIKIAKSVIIDTLTGNLDGAAYSQSGNGYLKANGTYAYNTASNKLTSTKYNIDNTNFTEGVKVTVAQKALTGSIGDVVKTYGDALSFGTVSALAGKVTGDDVAANGATVIPTSANTSSSGRLKAGDHTQTLTGLSGADKDNYSYAGVTGSYTVKPKELTIGVGTVKDKPADGTTSAVVTAGTLVGVMSGENLGLSATGNFVDPNMGNGKVVNALYNLQNGVNGEASNYILNIGTPANPDSRLRGNITASVNPVINPTPSPVNNNTGSRVSTVSGFGGSGAATGVLDDKPVTESREVCSDVFPENCECQPSVIPTIEICFAPKRVAATKEEK